MFTTMHNRGCCLSYVVAVTPKTLSKLKNAIIVEINNIEVQVVQCVIQNFCKRLELCQKSDGSNFEIFICKCEYHVNRSDKRLKNKTYHNEEL